LVFYGFIIFVYNILHMNKIILTKQQVYGFVEESKYKVNPKSKFQSRCIDGRYPTSPRLRGVSNLPALAIPGADAGELALIFATANSYGFEVDMKKVWDSLIELVGGEVHLQFHTDSHAESGVALAGCGHIKQINIDSKAYDLTDEQVQFIKDQFLRVKKSGVFEIELHGDHQEGAVLMISGNWGVFPQGSVKTDLGNRNVQVFVYHQSLVDDRHRALTKQLMKNKAIQLPDKCDEEHLFHALCEVGENHLLETSKRLAKGLPIFSVVFAENGEYKVEEIGEV